MKKEEENVIDDLAASREITDKLRQIMLDKRITQRALAEYAGTSPSQFSRIMNGELAISVQHIANIARELRILPIDIYTYPDVYRDKMDKNLLSDKKVSITFEVDPQERDHLLKLVYEKQL